MKTKVLFEALNSLLNEEDVANAGGSDDVFAEYVEAKKAKRPHFFDELFKGIKVERVGKRHFIEADEATIDMRLDSVSPHTTVRAPEIKIKAGTGLQLAILSRVLPKTTVILTVEGVRGKKLPFKRSTVVDDLVLKNVDLESTDGIEALTVNDRVIVENSKVNFTKLPKGTFRIVNRNSEITGMDEEEEE